ncbi:MAG: hypothetical protein WEB58_07400 [Planctomycetaceae bacterium]
MCTIFETRHLFCLHSRNLFNHAGSGKSKFEIFWPRGASGEAWSIVTPSVLGGEIRRIADRLRGPKPSPSRTQLFPRQNPHVVAGWKSIDDRKLPHDETCIQQKSPERARRKIIDVLGKAKPAPFLADQSAIQAPVVRHFDQQQPVLLQNSMCLVKDVAWSNVVLKKRPHYDPGKKIACEALHSRESVLVDQFAAARLNRGAARFYGGRRNLDAERDESVGQLH